jgi:hypothetical protein
MSLTEGTSSYESLGAPLLGDFSWVYRLNFCYFVSIDG